jgi:hypothetical protein
MIVQRFETELVLIRQSDHAALAGHLMEAWQAGGLPANPRRDAILLATATHDNGWVEVDGAPTIDGEGQPVDFITSPLAVKQGVWPRTVDALAQDDFYAAALVAQHALTVYSDYREKPEWQGFFAAMAERRTVLLGRAGPAAAAAIDNDYRFVRMGDILSLIVTGGWRQPYEHDGRQLARTGETLTVTPDPFGGATVAIALPARRIPRRRYASDEDLRAAFHAASVEWQRGTASGGRA